MVQPPAAAPDPDISFEGTDLYTPEDKLTFQEQLLAQLSLIRKYGSRLDFQPHFTRAVYILYTLLLPHDLEQNPTCKKFLADADALETRYDAELEAELKEEQADRDSVLQIYEHYFYPRVTHLRFKALSYFLHAKDYFKTHDIQS